MAIKIKKGRCYLYQSGTKIVLVSKGDFPTMTKAHSVMFRDAPEQPDPRCRLQERIPGFEGVSAIHGRDVIRRFKHLRFDAEVSP